MAVITVIDRRSGQAKTMEMRFAKILVALGKAEFVDSAFVTEVTWDIEVVNATYETKHLEADLPKRRGRPPKALSEQADKD